MKHILLPALDEARSRVLTEEMVEVEPEANGLRLLHSPAFVDGLAAGDVISLDPTVTTGFRLVSRGGNLAVVLVFPSSQLRVQHEPDLASRVRTLGGMCDGGPSRTLVCTIPVSAGFPSVEALFNRVPEYCPGATWYFGNVYGVGQEPLNWWLVDGSR